MNPLARTGAEVTGIDIARNLVEAGNKRTAEAGLSQLKCQEGDACNLEGVADHSFDLTVSVFGAMFAPSPSMSPRRWCASTNPKAASSWANGFQTIRRSYLVAGGVNVRVLPFPIIQFQCLFQDL